MMNRLTGVAVLGLITSLAMAQSKPASNPASSPATAPSTRPGDPAAVGEWEFSQGNFSAAAEAFAKAPPTAMNLFHLGIAQMEMIRATPGAPERSAILDKARESLRKSLAADPNFLDAQRVLANLAWGAAVATHRWSEYIAEADKLLAKDATDHATFFKRGLARAEDLSAATSQSAGAVDAVLADFRKAIQLHQQETRYWLETIRFLQKHRDAEVVPTFDNALRVNPGSYPLRSAYGVYLRSKDRKEDSLRQVELAIAYDPNAAMGYVIRSQHFLGTKNLDEAFLSLKTAMAKDNTDPRVYRELAVLELAQGRPQQAIQALQDAVKVVAAQMNPSLPPQVANRLGEEMVQLESSLGNLLMDRLKAAAGSDRAKVLQEVHQFVAQLDQLLPQAPLRAKYSGLLAHVEDHPAQAVPLLERALNAADGSLDAQVAEALARDYLFVGQSKRASALLEAMRQQPGQGNNPALTTMLAEADVAQNDFTAAAAHIDESLKIDANYAPAASLRAILPVLRGDRDTLNGQLKSDADVKLTPEAVDLLAQRASQLASAGKVGPGLALLEDLHRRDGSNHSVLLLLLDGYIKTGKKVEADKLLAEVRATDEALAARVQEELSLRDEKDPQKRFEVVKARILREMPEGLPRLMTLANLCQAAQQMQEYQQYIEEAAKIDPNNPEVIERSFHLAGGQKDWDKARQWAQRAAALNLDGVGGRHYSARLAMGQNDVKTATALLQEGLRLQPQWKAGKVLLGECYQEANRLVDARRMYQEVYDADPNFATAVIGLAVLSAMEHNAAEQATWVERAMKLPEGQRNPFIQSSYLDLRQGKAKPEDLDAILEARGKLYNQNPRDMQNAMSLAILLEQANRFEDAKKVYTQIYEVSPSKLMGVRPLAEYLIRKGENSELITLLLGLEDRDADKTGARVVAAQYLRFYSPEMAMATLEKAIAADPNDPRPYETIARFYESQRKWPQALDAYERFQKIVPGHTGITKGIIRCLIEMGKFEESDHMLAGLLLNSPKDTDVLMLQAQLDRRMRRYDQSLACYDKVLAQDANDLPAQLGRLYVLQAMNDSKRLREGLVALRSKYSSPEVLMEYAAICQQAGDPKAAEMAYLDILKNQKNNLPALRALTSMYTDRQNWVSLEGYLAEARSAYPNDLIFVLIESEMWKARGSADKQVTSLEAAVKMAPTSLEAAGALLTVLLDAKQYDRVLAAAEPMMARPEVKAIALAAKGTALELTKKSPEAEAAFMAAVSENLSPQQLGLIGHQIADAYGAAKGAEKLAVWIRQRQLDNPNLGVLLGILYDEAKNYPKSIEVLLKARDLMKSPDDKASLNRTLAGIYYGNKQAAAARDLYLEMLKTQGDDVQILNNLAFLYAEDLNDPNGGLPYAKRATELVPGNPSILDTYGWTLFLIGKTDEATATLFKAVELMPGSSVLRYHLGRVLEKAGSTADAQHQYEEGLKTVVDAAVKKNLQEALDRVKPPAKK